MEPDARMALYIGASMAIVMLSFMLKMYPDRRKSIAIYAISGLIIVGGVLLLRSQATVGQVAYMRDMIPHLSIAILTSERANITDPRVRDLADEIGSLAPLLAFNLQPQETFPHYMHPIWGMHWLWWLLWILVIVAVLWALSRLLMRPAPPSDQAPSESPLDRLERRSADG